MNKEFIPYEESVALKELGFDEPCLAWFSDRSIRIVGVNGCALSSLPVNSNFDGDDEFVTAPLYSQAFRWFREKHKLYHTINMFGDWDKPQYSYLVSGRTMNNPAHMWYFEDKDSHEEAELACLKKLIEIVKNK
jgi:hypothetical protein